LINDFAGRLRARLERRPLFAVGLMVGTSLDGVDAALLELPTRGDWTRARVRAHRTSALHHANPGRLRELAGGAPSTVAELSALRLRIARDHEDAVRTVCAAVGLDPSALAWVSAHGVTLWHEPQAGHGWQLHAGAALASWLCCPVIDELRLGDIALGGQGAPLAPLADLLLRRSDTEDRVILNLGGIANLTALPAGVRRMEDVHAGDVGPANLLLDGLCRLHDEGQEDAFDRDGALGLSGSADEALVERLMKEAWVRKPLPRSYGREQFGPAFLGKFVAATEGLREGDRMATAVLLEARAVAIFLHELIGPWRSKPGEELRVFLTGGGRHNVALTRALQRCLPEACVTGIESLGISADAKEAVDFAVIGGCSLLGELPSVSTVTGARADATLGTLHLPPLEAQRGGT
jgi:anhydro-N-acetylmuramic acid kinase